MIKDMGFEFSIVLDEKENSTVEYCIHPTLKDELICKSYFFNPNVVDDDKVIKAQIDSLEQEASLGAKLSSQIYPKVRDLKEVENRYYGSKSLSKSNALYLVRDYVGGISFEQLGKVNHSLLQSIQAENSSKPKATQLQNFWLESMLKLSEGLYELQGLGYAHGDLNLTNLRLDTKGQVKLMDFGMACKLGEFKGGTPEFYSPGHLAGNLDSRSDLFAVGLHLCYWVFGTQPLLSKSLSEVSLFISGLEHSARRLDDWLQNQKEYLPKAYALEWAQIIRSCLLSEEQGGYEDLDEFIENLEILKKSLSKIEFDIGNTVTTSLLEEPEFKQEFELEQKSKEENELNYFKEYASFWEPSQQLAFFRWAQGNSQLQDEWALAWQELEAIKLDQKRHWKQRGKNQLKAGAVAVVVIIGMRILFPSFFEDEKKAPLLYTQESKVKTELKMLGFKDSLKYPGSKPFESVEKKSKRVLFKMTPTLKEELLKKTQIEDVKSWTLNGQKLMGAGIWMNVTKLKKGLYKLKAVSQKGETRCWSPNYSAKAKSSSMGDVEFLSKMNWAQEPCTKKK